MNTTTILVQAFAHYMHDHEWASSRAIVARLNTLGVRVQEPGQSRPVDMMDMIVLMSRDLGDHCLTFSTAWERNGAVIAERRAHPGSGGCGGRCGS